MHHVSPECLFSVVLHHHNIYSLPNYYFLAPFLVHFELLLRLTVAVHKNVAHSEQL